MAKGLLIEALAPGDDDEESESPMGDPPEAPTESPDALIASIEAQLGQLRRAVAELG